MPRHLLRVMWLATAALLAAVAFLAMSLFPGMRQSAGARQAWPAAALTRTVGLDCAAIQDCIGLVPIGGAGAVVVPIGVYTENLVIENRAVSLIGAGSDATIVRAAAAGPVLELQGPIISQTVIITGLTFAGGAAETAGGTCDAFFSRPDNCGGGILVWDSAQPIIANVALRDNRAGQSGGGLYVAGNIPLTLTGVTLTGNTAQWGGGAYAAPGSHLTLIDSLVMSNTATGGASGGGGGGVYVDGQMTARRARFIGNESAYYGGGARVAGQAEARDCVFAGNRAPGLNAQGGGLYASGPVSILNSDFTDNRAGSSALDGYGGGLASANAVTLTGGLLYDNRSSGGGAVYVAYHLTLIGTQVVSNAASFGGGVYQAGGIVKLTRGRFERNTGDVGGAVYAFGALAISATDFLSNTVAYEGGAGRLQGAIRIENSLFQGNRTTRAAADGGAVYLSYSLDQVFVTGTQFLGNAAGGRGGGVFLHDGYAGNARLVNTLFARNASGGPGAAVAIDAYRALTPYHISLIHVTIAGASGTAVAVARAAGASVEITNTLIASHSIAISATQGRVIEDYNLYFGNALTHSGSIAPGSHSLVDQPPGFADPSRDDYRIGPASAAIGRGIDAGVRVDFEGQPRHIPPDIGYDEAPRPPAPILGLRAANNSPTPLGSATALTASVDSGGEVAYAWLFGDGATGQGDAVSHVYPSAGLFTATVSAANAISQVSVSMVVTITPAPQPIAGLAVWSDAPKRVGQAVRFTATVTTGVVLTYSWSFGDGAPVAAGSKPEATHTYTAWGVFTATVNAAGSDSQMSATARATIEPFRCLAPVVLR